ncbi:MAG TPA: hypothetical protein VIK22_00555, partial [Candidatus Anoxymicrobiaceae bacterium]
TLPSHTGWRRRVFSFLWRFPSGRPAWTLSSTLPFGVRTFLEAQGLAATRMTVPDLIVALPSPLLPIPEDVTSI